MGSMRNSLREPQAPAVVMRQAVTEPAPYCARGVLPSAGVVLGQAQRHMMANPSPTAATIGGPVSGTSNFLPPGVGMMASDTSPYSHPTLGLADALERSGNPPPPETLYDYTAPRGTPLSMQEARKAALIAAQIQAQAPPYAPAPQTPPPFAAPPPPPPPVFLNASIMVSVEPGESVRIGSFVLPERHACRGVTVFGEAHDGAADTVALSVEMHDGHSKYALPLHVRTEPGAAIQAWMQSMGENSLPPGLGIIFVVANNRGAGPAFIHCAQLEAHL